MKHIFAWSVFVLIVTYSVKSQETNPNIHSSGSSQGQAPPPAKRSQVDESAIRELGRTLHLWAQKEVVPTVREWKTTFDAGMEYADLTALNELRVRATELRKQQMNLVSRSRQAWRDFDDVAMDSAESQRAALRSKQKKLLNDLRPLATKYAASLQKLGIIAQPKVKQWIATAHMKIEDFAHAHSLKPEQCRPLWAHDYLSMLAEHPRLMKARSAARFMLWDGADITEFPQHPELLNVGSVDVTNLQATFTLNQNVPNPVVGGSTTISFTLRQYDHVKITIVDIKGVEVGVVTDTDYPAGNQVVEYSVGGLSNGQYVYRMVCSQGSLSNTMTITR